MKIHSIYCENRICFSVNALRRAFLVHSSIQFHSQFDFIKLLLMPVYWCRLITAYFIRINNMNVSGVYEFYFICADYATLHYPTNISKRIKMECVKCTAFSICLICEFTIFGLNSMWQNAGKSTKFISVLYGYIVCNRGCVNWF